MEPATQVVQNEREQPLELYLEDRVVQLGPHERVELATAALGAPQVRMMLQNHVLAIHPAAQELESPAENLAEAEPPQAEQVSQPPDRAAAPAEEI